MLKKAGVFFTVVLLSACASINRFTSSSTNEETHDESRSTTQTQAKYVETSVQEQEGAGRWISGQRDGRFIIVGVSGRLSKADDEIEAAKQDAARKASMFHGVQGSLETMNRAASNILDYAAESNLQLQYDTNYAQYVERLSFDPEKDVIRGNGATYIRFQYNASGPDYNYSPEQNTGRPDWTYYRNLPHFQDYTTVVGFAGRRSRLRDTISASCDSAAARLIESASTQVTTGENLATGYGSATTIHVRSEGRLSNFHVMEFWIDPDSGGVYTMATARVSK